MAESNRLRDLCMQWVAAAVLTCAVPSCRPDHRISLDQFLEMQKQVVQEAPEPAAPPPEWAAQLNRTLGPFQVGPNDVLVVNVLGGAGTPLFPPLHARITRDGIVDLPLVGKVQVGGLSFEDVEQRLYEAYVPAFATAAVVHVDVVGPHLTNVLVTGAVSLPGLVRLPRHNRNLLYAIVGAGGVSELASGRALLRRLRSPDQEETFVLTDPVGLASALSLDPLEDGDIIEVEASQPSLVFVGGLVNLPAVQPLPSGTSRTVLQAVAASAGLRTDVMPKEGTLIRRMPDNTEVQVKLPLNAIARGEAPNIELAPGDILWVPETWETKVHDWINRNVYLRAGASVTYTATGVEYLNRPSQQNGTSRSTEDRFDPLGFLQRDAALRSVQQQLGP